MLFFHQGVWHWDGVAPSILWILGLGQKCGSYNANLTTQRSKLSMLLFQQCEPNNVGFTLGSKYFHISICIWLKAKDLKVLQNFGICVSMIVIMFTHDFFSSWNIDGIYTIFLFWKCLCNSKLLHWQTPRLVFFNVLIPKNHTVTLFCSHSNLW